MSKEIDFCIGSGGPRNLHWIFPFKEEDLKKYLPPFANQLSGISKKAGLEYEHEKPIFIVTSSDFFIDCAPKEERKIIAQYPCRNIGRYFEKKGFVVFRPYFIYEPIEKNIFKTAEMCGEHTYYDPFTFLKHAQWKTYLDFDLRRLGVLEPFDNDPFVVSDDASFGYYFNENQMFEEISSSSARFGTPAHITTGQAISISPMILPEKELKDFGPLKIWSTETDNQTGREYILPKHASKELKEQIIKSGKREFTSYDDIITLYFGDNCGVPLTGDLQNINLETMVVQIVPTILEKMIDFVKN